MTPVLNFPFFNKDDFSCFADSLQERGTSCGCSFSAAFVGCELAATDYFKTKAARRGNPFLMERGGIAQVLVPFSCGFKRKVFERACSSTITRGVYSGESGGRSLTGFEIRLLRYDGSADVISIYDGFADGFAKPFWCESGIDESLLSGSRLIYFYVEDSFFNVRRVILPATYSRDFRFLPSFSN